jgi:hypothetical protein
MWRWLGDVAMRRGDSEGARRLLGFVLLFTTDSFIPTSPFNFHLSLAYTPFGGKLDAAAVSTLANDSSPTPIGEEPVCQPHHESESHHSPVSARWKRLHASATASSKTFTDCCIITGRPDASARSC